MYRRGDHHPRRSLAREWADRRAAVEAGRCRHRRHQRVIRREREALLRLYPVLLLAAAAAAAEECA